MVEKVVYKSTVVCPVCQKDDFYTVGMMPPRSRIGMDEELETCYNCHIVRVLQPKVTAP